jgi:LysM repeat protein
VAETPAQPTADLELTITPTFTPSPPPTPTEPIYTGIFLELVFTDTSWIQVTVDGVRQFQGELERGTYRSWYGEQRIELRAGNAGAVEATINGQRLGPLGGTGEVVDQVFEVVDNQVAAATPTRAPTLIPAEETATAEAPTPTPTIMPTATITPTSTSSLEVEPAGTSTPSSATEAPAVALTPVIHVVKLGDSLYGISLTYDTTVDAIIAANGLESNNLRVGQELVIPVGTITPAPTLVDTPEATPTPS